ncbi:MAG: hypothetical protein AAF456_07845 [Planctomycetota bacterium]
MIRNCCIVQLALTAGLAVFATPIYGQQAPGETSRASFVFQEEDADAQWQLDPELTSSLEGLRAELIELRSLGMPEPLLDSPMASPQSTNEIFSFNDKVEEIDRRINLLKTIYEQESAAPETTGEPSGDGPVNRSPQAATALTGSGNDIRNEGTSINQQPLEAYLPPSTSYLSGENGESSPQLVLITGDRVLPEPVNAFEMGNSLLMTGSAESALKAYESVDRTQLNTFDAIWLDFLIATCKRRTGDIDGAEAIYREITNDQVITGHPVEEAAWWLDRIEQSSAAEEKYRSIESELAILIQRAENHVKK